MRGGEGSRLDIVKILFVNLKTKRPTLKGRACNKIQWFTIHHQPKLNSVAKDPRKIHDEGIENDVTQQTLNF